MTLRRRRNALVWVVGAARQDSNLRRTVTAKKDSSPHCDLDRGGHVLPGSEDVSAAQGVSIKNHWRPALSIRSAHPSAERWTKTGHSEPSAYAG